MLCQVCLKDQSYIYIGPLLFIMYINNVSDVVSSDTHLNMFADDMAIYRIIKDYDTLQEDINSVLLLSCLANTFISTHQNVK